MDYDVIIIGGGPAGLSAALWCDELGLRALLLESNNEFGGQLLRTYNAVDNHLGSISESGRELADFFISQTQNRAFSRKLNAKVVGVNFEEKIVETSNDSCFLARALIIATGVRRRKLNIEGENEFAGKGIFESGKRYLQNANGKNVVIVGGGDAAVENALILSEVAKKVFLVHHRNDLGARREFVDQLKKLSNLDIFYDSELAKIIGRDCVEAVEIINAHNSELTQILADAVLVRIGVQPNSDLFDDKLILDKNGYVKVNERCETSVVGVFAIGDVANPTSPTVSSAVGTGATVAKCIHTWLNS